MICPVAMWKESHCFAIFSFCTADNDDRTFHISFPSGKLEAFLIIPIMNNTNTFIAVLSTTQRNVEVNPNGHEAVINILDNKGNSDLYYNCILHLKIILLYLHR